MRSGRVVWVLRLGLLLVVSLAVVSMQAASGPDAQTGWLSGWRIERADLPPEPGRPSYTVGISSNPNATRGPLAARSLGSSLVRIEWVIGTPATALDSIVAAYARVGVRVQPLATFDGRIPTRAEAESLRSWALRFGPTGTFWPPSVRRLAINAIEFGNETSYRHQYGDQFHDASYSNRARDYAQRARDAAVALRGTGVGLLVQADDGGSKTSIWVDRMFESVPDLGSYAAGWVVHPYGPESLARIDRIVASLGARGVPLRSIRIFVTEWGLATDDGRVLDDNYGYPRNMSYTDAARTLQRTISRWRESYGDLLAQVILYTDFDYRPSGASSNREDYFGIFRVNGADKGAYTDAVRGEILAARAGEIAR
jgi:hypothetical protein